MYMGELIKPFQKQRNFFSLHLMCGKEMGPKKERKTKEG